jgi:hypothetical protein
MKKKILAMPAAPDDTRVKPKKPATTEMIANRMASFSMTSPLCVELPSACKLHAITVIVDFLSRATRKFDS